MPTSPTLCMKDISCRATKSCCRGPCGPIASLVAVRSIRTSFTVTYRPTSVTSSSLLRNSLQGTRCIGHSCFANRPDAMVESVNKAQQRRAWNPFAAPLLLATTFGAVATSLIALPFEKDVQYDFVRDPTPVGDEHSISTNHYDRSTVYFDSHGTKCEAWLYEPKGVSGTPPVVVMAHGLGSQKDMGLHVYAEQFVEAGMVVLVFDYRGFGGSDGEPRHLVSWSRHLEDWEAAVRFIKNGGLKGRVDSNRIALWGISYSGGHVLTTASRLGSNVSAVVANEPYLTSQGAISKALRERGLPKVLRVLGVALHDQVRSLLGQKPAYIKLYGGSDELALLEMVDQDLSLIQRPPPKRQGGWKNLATARMVLENVLYHPIVHVHKITASVLVVAGTMDVICPIEHVRRAVSLMGDRATLLEKPYGHIQLHREGSHPEELRPTIEFLLKHLNVSHDTTKAPSHDSQPRDTESAAAIESSVAANASTVA